MKFIDICVKIYNEIKFQERPLVSENVVYLALCKTFYIFSIFKIQAFCIDVGIQS